MVPMQAQPRKEASPEQILPGALLRFRSFRIVMGEDQVSAEIENSETGRSGDHFSRGLARLYRVKWKEKLLPPRGNRNHNDKTD